jgi:triosephosphate isomerase (TIM)
MTAPNRRTPIVAGNWKMNTTVPEAAALVDAMLNDLPFIDRVEKILCPPFVSLETVRSRVMGSGILVGAQNVFWEPKGAYTGEISVTMLQGLVDYVIVGHSERRQYFHETDADVNRKIVAALAGGLRVILCVGEPLSENEAGNTEAYVERQVRGGLEGVTSLDRLAVAYEPIWAIGTGRSATPEQAQEAIGFVRALVADRSPEQAERTRILYGGSVKPEGAAELLGLPDIDGALVGGASLDAESLAGIIEAVPRS